MWLHVKYGIVSDNSMAGVIDVGLYYFEKYESENYSGRHF